MYWVYPITWAQWMIMVQLQALFKNDDNCLLTVAGIRTNPKYIHRWFQSRWHCHTKMS